MMYKVASLVGTAGDAVVDAAVRAAFVPSRFCTPHCGKSMFEDWTHTPKCEADYEADRDAEEEG
jgi:hypothetical protein